MAAFAETLEQEWENADIPKASFHHTPIHDLQKGQLISHPTSKSYLRASDIFEIIQTLFVDDVAFIFESREDLTKGLEILRKIFDFFGLEMHLGKGNKASKTECVYFPEPAFFKPPAALPPIDSNSNKIVIRKYKNSLSFKKKWTNSTTTPAPPEESTSTMTSTLTSPNTSNTSDHTSLIT